MTSDDSDQLRRLEAVGDTDLARLDHAELLAVLLERVQDVLAVDTVAVLVADDFDEPSTLIAYAARGIEEEVRLGVRVPIGLGFAGRVASTRMPVILDHVGPDVAINPILWRRGLRSMIGVPLLVGGRLIGVMHVGSTDHRSFAEADVEVLATAAERVAATVAEGRAASYRAVARILQRSLLPPRLPNPTGVSLAARYIAVGDNVVGGDWYDAFELPDGRLGVAIGDVTGNGPRAAGVMARMRSALRCIALEVAEPAEVLARLDRTFAYFEPTEMATVCYGTIDAGRRTLTVASSGHLPPVVMTGGSEPALVTLRPGPPIGARVPGAPVDTAIDVGPSTIIVLYTDGLVERRDRSITDGLDALVKSLGPGSVEDVCHSIVDQLIDVDAAEDDTAVLVAAIADGA